MTDMIRFRFPCGGLLPRSGGYIEDKNPTRDKDDRGRVKVTVYAHPQVVDMPAMVDPKDHCLAACPAKRGNRKVARVWVDRPDGKPTPDGTVVTCKAMIERQPA